MTETRVRRGGWFWGAAAVVVILDLITKALAVRELEPGVPYRVIGDVARFTLAFNPGAAFSMSLGEWSRVIFGAFAVIALVVLWRLYRLSPPGDRLRLVALGLAWGGALGNLLDRLRSTRGVVDFIDVGIGVHRFWTFNVADSGVTVGAILLAWIFSREEARGVRSEE